MKKVSISEMNTIQLRKELKELSKKENREEEKVAVRQEFQKKLKDEMKQSF